MTLSPGSPPEEILPGCRRLALPDPFPPGVVCVFLLEDGERRWLADAGPPGEEPRRALDRGLASTGTGREALDGVLLSHVHLDHIGGLRGWTPSRLTLHAAAGRALQDGAPDAGEDARRSEALLRRMGVPEARLPRYREYREPRDRALARSLAPDRRLEGDAGELPEPGGWRWLRVSGHAPGHLLLFHPESRHLLAFDQFMGRLKTPLALSDPTADPWGDYLASLDRAEALQPEVLHPSHVGPIRPAVPWLRRRRSTLERQLGRVGEAVAEGAATAWDVTGRIYPGEEDRGAGRQALLLREVLAALRHLAAAGRARRETVEGVERYSA